MNDGTQYYEFEMNDEWKMNNEFLNECMNEWEILWNSWTEFDPQDFIIMSNYPHANINISACEYAQIISTSNKQKTCNACTYPNIIESGGETNKNAVKSAEWEIQ
jgi:hypothetical protein